MILRNATVGDFQVIDNLYKQYGFILDFKNIESLLIVEIDDKIVAVGSIVRILEASFLTTKESSKKERVIALSKLVNIADSRAKRLGYSSYHGFATNEAISKFLKKHFGFAKVVGEALIRWVN